MAKSIINEIEHIKSKCIITTNNCWEYQGKSKNSYPHLTRVINGKQKSYKVHKYMWFLYNGPIENNLHVLHKCDNTKCCNPDHLFLGNHSDNMKDMYNKKRHSVQWSEESRKKLSERVKGIKHTEERRKKQSESMKGKNTRAWSEERKQNHYKRISK